MPLISLPDEVHVGDVGTLFHTTIKDRNGVVNIAAATVKKFKYKRPNGSTFERVAAFTTNGEDGQMQYATVAGDLNLSGNWEVQAIITAPSGSWSSSIAGFTVHANL